MSERIPYIPPEELHAPQSVTEETGPHEESSFMDSPMLQLPATIQQELSQPISMLPVLYLSNAQQQRLMQYERVLRKAENNQMRLMNNETWVFPILDEDGNDVITEENKLLGVIIDQQTVDSLYKTGKTMATSFKESPNMEAASKMVRDKLTRERDSKIAARKEAIAEDTQKLVDLWERSDEVL